MMPAKRITLILAAILVLAGCGNQTGPRFSIQTHHPAQPVTTARLACVSEDCGPYAATVHWAGISIASQTGYYVYKDAEQVADVATATYTFHGIDCGTSFTIGVRAHNGTGGTGNLYTISYSAPSCGGGAAPVNQVAPYFCGSTSPSVAANGGLTGGCTVLTGDAVVGQTLTVGTGAWTNSPTSFAYQWRDCKVTNGQPPTVGSCSDITGATSSSYTVQSSDRTACSGGPCALTVAVTASNGTSSSPTTVSGACNVGSTTYAPSSGTQTYADPRITAGCSPISAQVGTTTGTGSGAMVFCTNAPVTCGLGDPLSGNAGVPPGTTLTPGSIPNPCNGTLTGLYVTSGTTIDSGTCTIQNSRVVGSLHLTGNPGQGANVTFNHDDLSGPYTGQSTATTGTGQATNISAQCSYTANAGEQGGDTVYVVSGQGQGTFNNVYAHCAAETLQGPGSIDTSYIISDECWGPCAGAGTTHNESIYTQGNPAAVWQHIFLANNFDTSTGVVFNDTCSSIIDVEDSLGAADVNSGNGAWGINNCRTDFSEIMQNTRVSRLYRSDATCGFSGESSKMTWSGNIWDDTAAVISSC